MAKPPTPTTKTADPTRESVYTGPDYRPYLDALLDELDALRKAIIAAAILQRTNRSPKQLAAEASEYDEALAGLLGVGERQ